MIFKSFFHTKRYTWILLHDEKVIATGVRYKTEQERDDAIKMLRKGVAKATVVQLEKQS